MVKFISRLGGLFGGNKKTPKKEGPKPSKPKAKPSNPKKPSKQTHTPPTKKQVNHTPTHSKPRQSAAKPASKSAVTHVVAAKPLAKRALTHAVQKPSATLQKKTAPAKPDEHLRSLVLFITPTCPDCASARKLVNDVRRIAHKTILREVDLSTKDGELEGLLNGVVQSPSFMINGRLVFRGVLPARDQLLRVITEGAFA